MNDPSDRNMEILLQSQSLQSLTCNTLILTDAAIPVLERMTSLKSLTVSTTSLPALERWATKHRDLKIRGFPWGEP